MCLGLCSVSRHHLRVSWAVEQCIVYHTPGTGTNGPSTKASSQPYSTPESTSDDSSTLRDHDGPAETCPCAVLPRNVPDRTDIDRFVSTSYLLEGKVFSIIIFSVAIAKQGFGPPHRTRRREREKHARETHTVPFSFGRYSKWAQFFYWWFTIVSLGISVADYLIRLSKFFHCSGECFVIALVYLDRAVKEAASVAACDVAAPSVEDQSYIFNITRLNVHRWDAEELCAHGQLHVLVTIWWFWGNSGEFLLVVVHVLPNSYINSYN